MNRTRGTSGDLKSLCPTACESTWALFQALTLLAPATDFIDITVDRTLVATRASLNGLQSELAEMGWPLCTGALRPRVDEAADEPKDNGRYAPECDRSCEEHDACNSQRKLV